MKKFFYAIAAFAAVSFAACTQKSADVYSSEAAAADSIVAVEDAAVDSVEVAE